LAALEDDDDDSDAAASPRKRKPAAKKAKPAAKKSPAKKAASKAAVSDDSDDSSDDSSDDDEPLVKKTKSGPSKEDIKAAVAAVLEGANLEEMTKKKVCALFPYFIAFYVFLCWWWGAAQRKVLLALDLTFPPSSFSPCASPLCRFERLLPKSFRASTLMNTRCAPPICIVAVNSLCAYPRFFSRSVARAHQMHCCEYLCAPILVSRSAARAIRCTDKSQRVH